MFIKSTNPNKNTKHMKVTIVEIQEFMINTFLLINMFEQKTPLKQFLNSFEKRLIKIVLILTEGNQKKAAFILGIKPTTLFEKMKKHRIKSKLFDTRLNNLYSNKDSEQIFSLLQKMQNINSNIDGEKEVI